MSGVTNKEVHDQALALPLDERARLAHDIIASLDGPADEGAAEEWMREIERRVREVKNGSVKLVDWKDTRARILKRLSAGK
jgi:putative addiction module component (TIGR02574 family)